MKTTTTPTCRLCNAEACESNPIDFHSDACARCIEADESLDCTNCGGGIEDARAHADGMCCDGEVECPCGNLVPGPDCGTPRCAHCDQPLCEECQRYTRCGDRVHSNSDYCQ